MTPSRQPTMLRFFLTLLAGNLASKGMLLTAESVALVGLSQVGFGAYSLLQSVVLAAPLVAVWGADQALINLVGAARQDGYAIGAFVRARQRQVALRSVLLIVPSLAAMAWSSVSFHVIDYLLASVIIVVEAQLLLASAVFRSSGDAVNATVFFDGQRHLALLTGALLVLTGTVGASGIFVCWAVLGMISLALGRGAMARLLADRGDAAPVPDTVSRHALDISRFSGGWAVVQMAVARLVILASGFLLTQSELGAVAFYMKLMIIFTFLQTLIVHSMAPRLGGITNDARRGDAKRLNTATTFFLAALVAPATTVILVHLPLLERAFKVHDGASYTVAAIFLGAQVFNIGTGIIGQYIIHFGYARQLLYLSLAAVVLQFALLLTIGDRYGTSGVLLSFAASSVFLTVTKNMLASRKFDMHGLFFDNGVMFLACAAIVLMVPPIAALLGQGTVELLLLLLLYAGLVVALAWRNADVPFQSLLGRVVPQLRRG